MSDFFFVSFLALPPLVEGLELVLVVCGEETETVPLDAEVVPRSLLRLNRLDHICGLGGWCGKDG